MELFIAPGDLVAFATIDDQKAASMIADAEAVAVSVAPCLLDPDDDTQVNPALTAHQLNLVKAVLRGAILRWHDAGSGATVQQTAGPFSQTIDTSRTRRAMFWKSEIQQLKAVCSGSSAGGVFGLDRFATAAAVTGEDVAQALVDGCASWELGG